jgi:hypothetical protein
MSFFKRKPIVVEAMQFEGKKPYGLILYLLEDGSAYLNGNTLKVITKNDLVTVALGDWIVKDQGQIFVYKSDVFVKLFEAAVPTEVEQPNV